MKKIDYYPEKDRFIPEAELIADAKTVQAGKINGKGADRKCIEWTRFFLGAMDMILFKKGLRVL